MAFDRALQTDTLQLAPSCHTDINRAVLGIKDHCTNVLTHVTKHEMRANYQTSGNGQQSFLFLNQVKIQVTQETIGLLRSIHILENEWKK